MVDAGELAEMADSGNVSITNVTDSLTFKQLRRVRVSIVTEVVKLETISNTLDKQFNLRDFWIDGQIYLTQPEVSTWVGWTVQTLNLPDPHSWNVNYITDDSSTATLTGTFRLASLVYNSEDEGYAVYDVKLESVDGVPVTS